MRTPPAREYAYLLGMYLGDGHIANARRGVTRLRIAIHKAHVSIAEECAAAIRAVMAANRVALHHHRTDEVVHIGSYSKQWPCLLPQHGPGRKHTRSIELAEWQTAITRAEPEAFVRGLIHSDGCRWINTVRAPGSGRVYSYARYGFCNRSADITGILTGHLDLLGVEWRPMGRWQISVARRASVAALDAFVGPKF